MTSPVGCSCGARWPGLSACHCPTCHRTFTTVGNFDRHRVGPMGNRHCADPESVGLVLNKRGLWSMPPKGGFPTEGVSRAGPISPGDGSRARSGPPGPVGEKSGADRSRTPQQSEGIPKAWNENTPAAASGRGTFEGVG